MFLRTFGGQRPPTIPKANTYGFLTNKWSPQETQECDLWQGTYVSEVYEPLVDDQRPHYPPFLSKIAMNDHFQ
jgi:hypothetical protein